MTVTCLAVMTRARKNTSCHKPGMSENFMGRERMLVDELYRHANGSEIDDEFPSMISIAEHPEKMKRGTGQENSSRRAKTLSHHIIYGMPCSSWF